MKLTFPLAALAAALTLAGCEQARHARRLTPEAAAVANVSMAEKQLEIQARLDALKAYLAERRTQFVSSMQEKLADMDQKLAALDDTITSLENNSIAEENLAAVHELRSNVESQFAHLTRLSTESTSAESWDDAQRTFESAWTKLQQAYQLVKALYGN